MVGLVWKLFCSLRSCSVIVEFVVCDGGEAMWGPATQTVFFFFSKTKLEVFFKRNFCSLSLLSKPKPTKPPNG